MPEHRSSFIADTQSSRIFFVLSAVFVFGVSHRFTPRRSNVEFTNRPVSGVSTRAVQCPRLTYGRAGGAFSGLDKCLFPLADFSGVSSARAWIDTLRARTDRWSPTPN